MLKTSGTYYLKMKNNVWHTINSDTFGLIVQFLTLSDFIKSQEICKSWRHNGKEKSLCAIVFVHHSKINALIKSFANNIKKLKISQCIDVDLLLISQLAKLQHLVLWNCNKVTDEGLRYLVCS